MSKPKSRQCGHCGQEWFRSSRTESLRFCPDCDPSVAWCFKCETVKNCDEFNSNVSTRNGFERMCRNCAMFRKLQDRYGIDRDTYETYHREQAGLCAICLRPPADGQPLHVDHCHEAGHVRGLLCAQCNTAIGLLKENLDVIQRAANYLELSQIA